MKREGRDRHEDIAIAGAGRLAQALGRLLVERKWPVAAVASRSPVHARQAAAFVGHGVAAVPYAALGNYATRFLICVSDDAIAPVAEELAAAGVRAGIAVHSSGVHGAEPLGALARAGLSCGTLHPLQTIASPEQGIEALPRAFFAVAGEEAAAGWAEAMVRSLGGEPLRIPLEAKPLYHAAAVLASNYLIGLIDAAVILMERAGVEAAQARAALAPLVRASVDNALRMTPEAALTGPIRRGDLATVRSHLSVLAAASPAIAELYRAAGRHVIDLARRAGLSPEAAARVDDALSAGASDEHSCLTDPESSV
ncbi:MAG: DUF2520 domain-containing protein [Acidobacteria bacterium]|nr:DUF2520 domain-containing protein [Acidobacteriota bacterium]